MIKREELLVCEKIQSIAFAYPLDTTEWEKKRADEPDPVNPAIGFFNDENTLTACMELPAYQMRYENQWVKMVGIGGVASLPEHRFGGAVRQLIQAAMRQIFDNGAVFSALYPFSHSYYRKFGYELCQKTAEYEVPIETLSGFRYTGKATMIHPGDATDGLRAVFDAHFQRYNMPILREERHWKKLIGEDAYKDRVYTYLLEDEKGPSAYVVVAAENAGQYEKTGKVRELAFVRPQGFSDVLGFLYRLAAQYSKILVPLPDDIPLASIVEESYNLKCSCYDQQMARVINVKKALECKRHCDGDAYTLRVYDADIPENDGFFYVQCENGVVSADKKAGEAPDLTVDVRTLTQLLLGFLTIDEALYKKDAQVHANLETLRRVFVKRTVFLTEHF